MAIKIKKDDAGLVAKVSGIDVNPIPLNAFITAASNGDITIFNPEALNENGDPVKIMSKVPYTEFIKSDETAPVDALDLKADIDAQLIQTAPTDIAAGYKGLYSAGTNIPDLATDIADYNNGDWFFVGSDGTVDLGGGDVDLKANDQVKLSILLDTDGVTELSRTWGVIYDQSTKVSDIEGSAINAYDIVVDADYLGSIKTGSALQPFTDLSVAIANSSANDSILVKGIHIIAAEITLPHSLSFYGTDDAEIKYASYNASNGDIFSFEGDMTQKFVFKDITFRNAGGYGLLVKKTAVTEIRKCKFYNCGWNGTALHTVLSSSVSGVLGYDSTQAELQAFYAGANASNGGAVRLQECTKPLLRESRAEGCLRGFRLQDCGINGGGFVIENQSIGNIESGFYLAAGSLGGCQNITVTINYSSYNANNGLLCIGGINNKFSQNEVNGNWNAGFCAWGSSNVTLRDCGLYDNNRSQYNGIGNTGDAQASIQIGDAFGLIYDSITYNPAFRFIAEILDTQVHYTGLGSNTEKIGFYIAEDIGNLPDNDKNIIKVDDVGFIGQDYAIDFSDVDLTNLHVALGDNSYMSIGEKAVRPPFVGSYYELPFSNHVTRINYADFSIDDTGNIRILEGVGGMKLNPYQVNDLQAIADGTEIRVILKDSKKVQFNVPVAGCSIDGSYVNSVLNQALVQLNNLFTNTDGFASGGGNPVTNFELVSDDLTLTLEDGTSYTVDVTTLGVDSNNFVVSGEVVGSDLVLTMTDSSTVTIDAQNMINGSTLSSSGQGWFVSYGSEAGVEITQPVSGNYSTTNAPLSWGDKLDVGTEFVWSQYHLFNHANRYMSIGVWSGITHDKTGNNSTFVTNWSTKFGFFYNRLTEDTSTFDNGGYSSKNTDIGAGGVTYSNAAFMKLVYGADYRLRLYADDVLLATSVTPETGDPLDIQMVSSNTQVEFPNIIKRTSNWEIVHDFNNSEIGILDGIEVRTAIQSYIEINQGEKCFISLNRGGFNERFGLDWTGDSQGVTSTNNKVEYAFVYGSSKQIIPQNSGQWIFNESSPRFVDTGDGKWTVGGSAFAGNISLRYHTDNTLELYSETYQEVIATLVDLMNGDPFRLVMLANEAMSYQKIPMVSKQTLGQSFQPRTTYAPNVVNQSVNATEGDTLNYQIVATDYIVNQYVAENAPSWMSINQSTGVLSGVVPAYVGDTTDTVIVNCKAGNAVGGTTNFTVTINVQELTYTNTKSLRFAAGSSAYLTGNASNMNVMQRASNGSGASDAWSMSMWIRFGGNSATSHILNYGTDSTLNAGGIMLTQQSINNLVFTYGSGANYIGFVATGVITPNTWQHVLITYDGGTTGAASGSLSDYYSRFKLVIDGTIISPTFLQSNYGYTGSIPATNFFIGKNVFGSNPLQYARINQIAFWGSDEFANRAAIYNSGATQDLSLLASAPDNYYEVENSVTTIPDLIGNADLTGYNFVSADLVTDTP